MKILILLLISLYSSLCLAQVKIPAKRFKFPDEQVKREIDTKKKETVPQIDSEFLKPGQFLKELPVRKGPDGRPLLFAPNITKCQESK